MSLKISYQQMFSGGVLEGAVKDAVTELYTELVEFEGTIMPDYITYARPTLEQTIQELLINIDNCLMILVDGKQVGLLSADKGNPAEIAALYVKEDYRGRGFGRALINLWVSLNSHKEISVICFTTNRQALKFYAKVGFWFMPGKTTVKGTRAFN